MRQPATTRQQKADRARNVTAILGPTNTGKTHLAIERMLAHSSGIIGLPLRLLAREIYHRLVERAGSDAVALITGEEKIKPAKARYWVCTVEAMPEDADVAFVAIDEVQLAGNFERGHIFTDRILHLRGREETLLLGAATIRPLIEKLLPGVNIITRPRMSQLRYDGARKITRMPRRSAIVAFSADEVYAIAELIRRQQGGAAVVLGSLSPRTRNAQVELFQNGDVDYLVATDAIGMGLNLDVTHVAFGQNRKFDGYQYRALTAAEMGQIAGRAGRHMRDGTFGVTSRVPPLDDNLVEQLETHTFKPLERIMWRNRVLDYRSIKHLKASLDVIPDEEGLTRPPPAEDITALDYATRDADIIQLATEKDSVALLWETCQIPDYRNIAPANHADLIISVYTQLMQQGRIRNDWFAAQVAQTDRPEGDIDALSNRIAHIRTWTFVANRANWLDDPVYWQETTRAIEDRLSDALHDRLTRRFVDRRTSVLMRRLRENAMLEAEITSDGSVLVEGQMVGHLHGFRFAPDSSSQQGAEAKALRAAAQKVMATEIGARAEKLSQAGNEAFILASDGVIRWQGEPVARILADEQVLSPRIELIADEQLTGAHRDSVQERLDLWLKNHIETLLKPLLDLRDAADIDGMARGIAFQIVEGLGILDRQPVADEIRNLDQDARGTLRKYGIRFGAYHIYMPLLLKPGPRQLIAMLWALKHASLAMPGLDELPHLSATGRTSLPRNNEWQDDLYRIVGYRICGARVVRIDILERLADLVRPLIAWRMPVEGQETPDGALEGDAFTVTVGMTSLLGCSGEDFATVLKSLGYKRETRPMTEEEIAAQKAARQANNAPVKPADETVEAEASTEAPAETPAEASTETTADATAADQPETANAPVDNASDVTEAKETTISESASGETAEAEPIGDAVLEAEDIPTLEIWRPGRFNRGGQRKDKRGGNRNQNRGEARGGRNERNPKRDQRRGGGKGGNDQPRNAEKPRKERKERPADPNSPFAALAALKSKMDSK